MLHQNITLFPQGTGKRERVCWGFPGSSVVKNPPTMQETQVQTLDWEDPMEKGVDTQSSILFIYFFYFFHSNSLAWRIPWTEEPGGLQFIGPHRVRYE